MSRITHFKVQPKNIQYWDYYILCHLDVYAAIALQRFEYWDGTKRDGNVHAEDINDILEDLGEEITQDASRFFYKAQDELQWELMGLTGEKYTANLINFLVKDLNYLEQRNNPSNAMDRKKQYLFHDELVQDHVNYLGYIIDYFKRLGFRLNPIYYAIEQLTETKTYIDTLNIASVTDKLTEMHAQMDEDGSKAKESKKYKPTLPKFIRIQLDKDRDLLPRLKANKLKRFRNFAEWKAQICGLESVETRDATCKNTDSNPQESGSNSNNYKQQLQTTTTSRKDEAGQQDPNKTTKQRSSRPSARSEKSKEKIALSEEGRRIYDFACSELFTVNSPEITSELKEDCEELAKHIETLEQFKSLLQVVSSKLKPPYYLKNMINALNDWKQIQKAMETSKPTTTASATTQEKPKQINNLLDMLRHQEAMENEETMKTEGVLN